MVIVQGDTLTAYSGARAAHDARLPLAHVEAGLRTDSMSDPFPEEWFRRRIARYASLHFAPSASAERNLHRRGQSTQRRRSSRRQHRHRQSAHGCWRSRDADDAASDPLRNTILVTLAPARESRPQRGYRLRRADRALTTRVRTCACCSPSIPTRAFRQRYADGSARIRPSNSSRR